MPHPYDGFDFTGVPMADANEMMRAVEDDRDDFDPVMEEPDFDDGIETNCHQCGALLTEMDPYNVCAGCRL